jgi:hypothetical protein
MKNLFNFFSKKEPSFYPIEFILSEKINKVCEIGVRYGETTDFILKKCPNITEYHAIDPFFSYEEYGTDGANTIMENGDVLCQDYIKKYPSVILHRKLSDLAVSEIEDNTLDLIFIDGNHTYKYVYNDLKNYYPKIKKGGFITGHDFFMRSASNDPFNFGNYGEEKMVYEAVLDFTTEHNLQFHGFGYHNGYPMCFIIIK